MNAVQNFATIHLQLSQIDVLEVNDNTLNDLFNKVCIPNKIPKKIMFGNLLHVIVKMENIQPMLWMIQ